MNCGDSSPVPAVCVDVVDAPENMASSPEAVVEDFCDVIELFLSFAPGAAFVSVGPDATFLSVRPGAAVPSVRPDAAFFKIGMERFVSRPI